jgi:8-oxo-dGTP diphosphatase
MVLVHVVTRIREAMEAVSAFVNERAGERVVSEAESVCAVVCLVLYASDGAVLATQRPEGKSLGGFWEFPGGKIEPGEPAEDALRREIREELNLELGALRPLEPTEHEYDFGTIRLIPFLAACQGSSFSLNEHADARWLRPDELESVPWAPADIPGAGGGSP